MATTTRSRSRGWRLFRRTSYLLLLVGIAAVGGIVFLLARIELPEAVALDETSVIVDRNGEVIAEFRADENRFYVTLDEISPVLVDAVIAAEDRDFRSHSGVDPLAIARALWFDIRNEGVQQGGSTITQQYVKNVFLEPDRTLERKVQEAALAIRLERERTKDEILERYLNVIYFGRGAYGIEAASRAYFGISASELQLAQAAYLAGLIRAPETADVSRPEQVEEAERRRLVVLDAMVEEGYATAAQRDAVLALPLAGYVLERTSAGEIRIDRGAVDAGVEWFVADIRQQVIAHYDGEAAVFGRGLRIETTLDLDMQRAAYRTARDRLGAEGLPSPAMVTLDDAGGIRAMVGGLDWEASQVNLALGELGGGSGRQPGSSFKAIVLAEAVRQGISLDSRFEDPGTIVIAGADNGEDWFVSNYTPGDRGVIDLVSATASSSNTVYAQLITEVGPRSVTLLAEQMGVSAELAPVSSLTLGTEEVSVLDMAAAYSVLATGGVRHEVHAITEITSIDSTLDWRPSWDSARVLSEQEAGLVTGALEAVVVSGSGQRAAIEGVPVAGKTGTTQGAGDAWFVGFTPKFTTAVWVGYPEAIRPMVDLLGFDEITGGSVPAQLFSTYLSQVPDPAGGGTFAIPADRPGRVLGAELTTGPTTTPTTLPPASTTTTTSVPETTVPPTTASPTTAPPPPPTTAAPTTAAPTTAAPTTTVSPTTAPPTTASPTTAPPTTAESVG
ncbi:MAG: transglycosylase domain-containing protein [Actinomycetota bacterium]